MAKAEKFDDARMEGMMGRLLQAGVLLASTVVLAGGGMYLKAHATQSADYRKFTGYPLRLRHPAELVHGLARADPAAIVQLGVLLLVATPICRVVFAAAAFAVERDKLYVAVSLFVLAVLLFGLLHTG